MQSGSILLNFTVNVNGTLVLYSLSVFLFFYLPNRYNVLVNVDTVWLSVHNVLKSFRILKSVRMNYLSTNDKSPSANEKNGQCC